MLKLQRLPASSLSLFLVLPSYSLYDTAHGNIILYGWPLQYNDGSQDIN